MFMFVDVESVCAHAFMCVDVWSVCAHMFMGVDAVACVEVEGQAQVLSLTFYLV